MTARVTICQRSDGTFEILVNEAGRDLLVTELQRLDREWDHFHLDHFDDPEIAFATDVQLATVPYNDGDKIFQTGKVLLRPDDWDAEYFPHVLVAAPKPTA
jgi:hypothetical protein